MRPLGLCFGTCAPKNHTSYHRFLLCLAPFPFAFLLPLLPLPPSGSYFFFSGIDSLVRNRPLNDFNSLACLYPSGLLRTVWTLTHFFGHVVSCPRLRSYMDLFVSPSRFYRIQLVGIP